METNTPEYAFQVSGSLLQKAKEIRRVESEAEVIALVKTGIWVLLMARTNKSEDDIKVEYELIRIN